MSSVESFLSRELDLRFIDARTIAMEARLSLGIEGYPTKDQYDMLCSRATQIFASKSEGEKKALRQMKRAFERHDSMDTASSEESRCTISSSSSRQTREMGLLKLFR